MVFSDSPAVKILWHKYYALLSQTPGEERVHTWLELLQSMALDLNYSKLSQIDLDKFYVPQGHVDERDFQKKMAQHWERVLENTERFVVVPREKTQETVPLLTEGKKP